MSRFNPDPVTADFISRNRARIKERARTEPLEPLEPDHVESTFACAACGYVCGVKNCAGVIRFVLWEDREKDLIRETISLPVCVSCTRP